MRDYYISSARRATHWIRDRLRGECSLAYPHCSQFIQSGKLQLRKPSSRLAKDSSPPFFLQLISQGCASPWTLPVSKPSASRELKLALPGGSSTYEPLSSLIVGTGWWPWWGSDNTWDWESEAPWGFPV